MTNDEAFAMYFAQHFYVHDEEYTSNSYAVTDNESGYFSKEELSKTEKNEVSDDYFYAHLFDYESDNKYETKLAFSTPEKAAAKSLLKMPDSWPLLDKLDEDHSGHHPENVDKRRRVDVSFDGESPHINDLDKKLTLVDNLDDDVSKSSSNRGDVMSVIDTEKPPPGKFSELCLEVASTSSDSSEDILGLFDQDPNKKGKPLRGTYEEYTMEVVWKQQAYLESIIPKNGPTDPYKKLNCCLKCDQCQSAGTIAVVVGDRFFVNNYT